MRLVFFSLLLLAAQARAEVSGPIVRSLGNNYYLVQCNKEQLHPDDLVSIQRSGQEVAQGKVMREDGKFCSIQLLFGSASRLDLVVLKQRGGTNERGPALPAEFGSLQPTSKPASIVTSPRKADYFGTIQTNGGVYNLNTGQYLTP